MNSSTNKLTVVNTNNQAISPYDTSYPITLLSTSINRELDKAENIADDIYHSITKELPTLTQIQQASESTIRYVVDISDETIDAIENGVLKLTQENGNTYAQLLKNGKYSSKLPIKREEIHTELSPTQMTAALQLKAVQEQLQNIENQLIIIDGSVREILQGQQNDRIGLYYSGLSLFLESRYTTNVYLKVALQSQALRALAESTAQLKLTLQSDINYLKNKEFDKVKMKRKELITSHVNNINLSYAYIHQALMLRAAIYCDIGELASMAQVLQEYAYFIEYTIGNNATLLAQYDMNDTGTRTGLWTQRSQLCFDVQEVATMLQSPKETLYIGISEEVKE